MKRPLIVGNWKSNKTSTEMLSWIDEAVKQKEFINIFPGQMIICPPFPYLDLFSREILKHKLRIGIGAQDISPFELGAFTGEVAAEHVKEYASFVIIGHTERRKYFLESDELLSKKVAQAKRVGLSVIYCVNDEDMFIPDGVDVFSYEQTWAIGSGKPDTPEHAALVIENLKKLHPTVLSLYGGSVTKDNVSSYMSENCIDGVLLGGASLKFDSFFSLLQALS
ncbi:triosephosphate isomerase [Candidatus Gottesmanbacteria bacterium]|nr:triosephosphate isomerase [Candidatus Gottesmanbacteria bacterium]